jgi:hypothetical protein
MMSEWRRRAGLDDRPNGKFERWARADLTVAGTTLKGDAAAGSRGIWSIEPLPIVLSRHYHSQPTPPSTLSAIGPVAE